MTELKQKIPLFVKIVVLLASLSFVIFGGQALYVNLTNLSPATYNIEDYNKDQPEEMWLSLEGCHLNLLEATYSSYFGSTNATEVFIPIRSANASPDDPVVIFLGVKDEEILATMTKLNSFESEEELNDFVSNNPDQITFSRDIKGLVRFGVDLEDDIVKDLRDVNESVVDDFVILDEGTRPNWFMAIFFLSGGIALSWASWKMFRMEQTAATTAPPPLPGQPMAGNHHDVR